MLGGLALVSCRAHAPPAQGGSDCSGDLETVAAPLREKYLALRDSVRRGPFYRLAEASSGGPPRRCTRSADDGALRVAYEFASGATVAAAVDPRIELSEQNLTVSGISRERALELLRETERHAFGASGCGIAWDGPPEEQGAAGAREVAYRGETCNCQGRLVYSGETIRAILFRSAC